MTFRTRKRSKKTPTGNGTKAGRLPPPPIPENVDLRGMPFVPMHIERLLTSDFDAICSDAEWRAGVTLWCRAWQQVPAGSLPDDDRVLARLAGYGKNLRGWRKVKTNSLRGFALHNDGRLYHSVLCALAMKSWSRRVKWRTKKAAQRGGNPHDDHELSPGTPGGTDQGTTEGTDLRQGVGNPGEGEGEGEGEYKEQQPISPILSKTSSIIPRSRNNGAGRPPTPPNANPEKRSRIQARDQPRPKGERWPPAHIDKATIPDAWRTWAERQLAGSGHDLKTVYAQFSDYAGQVAGAAGISTDWQARFRIHVRQTLQRGRPKATPEAIRRAATGEDHDGST